MIPTHLLGIPDWMLSGSHFAAEEEEKIETAKASGCGCSTGTSSTSFVEAGEFLGDQAYELKVLLLGR